MAFVRATIIRRNCPKRLVQMAAGWHQSVQNNVEPVTEADTLAAIGRACFEKEQSKGIATLSDAQLWVILNSQGLAGKEVKEKGSKQGDQTSFSSDSAQQQMKKQVWLPWESSFFLQLPFSSAEGSACVAVATDSWVHGGQLCEDGCNCPQGQAAER